MTHTRSADRHVLELDRRRLEDAVRMSERAAGRFHREVIAMLRRGHDLDADVTDRMVQRAVEVWLLTGREVRDTLDSIEA